MRQRHRRKLYRYGEDWRLRGGNLLLLRRSRRVYLAHEWRVFEHDQMCAHPEITLRMALAHNGHIESNKRQKRNPEDKVRIRPIAPWRGKMH